MKTKWCYLRQHYILKIIYGSHENVHTCNIGTSRDSKDDEIIYFHMPRKAKD